MMLQMLVLSTPGTPAPVPAIRPQCGRSLCQCASRAAVHDRWPAPALWRGKHDLRGGEKQFRLRGDEFTEFGFRVITGDNQLQKHVESRRELSRHRQRLFSRHSKSIFQRGTPVGNRTQIRGLEIRCSIHLSYGSNLIPARPGPSGPGGQPSTETFFARLHRGGNPILALPHGV